MQTKKDLIFRNFLSRVTDDLFTTWEVEEVKQELEEILLNSLPKFKYSKVRLLNDQGELNEEKIGEGEIEILTLLMLKEWVSRKIHTVELVELQYTGSDAKSLNTPAQLKALMSLKASNEVEYQRYLNYYHMSDTNELGQVITAFNLSGKKK